MNILVKTTLNKKLLQDIGMEIKLNDFEKI